MIDVQSVLRELPHFDVFPSVEELNAMVERLRGDSRFTVELAGKSASGRPIHQVRFGKGNVKALFIGGMHAMEPIGNLTVYSLMSALQSNRGLLESDVEWHIVPSIDPDAMALNEGWSGKPFTFGNYVRNFYLQWRPDQVDFSFPINHKKMVFDRPSTEAQVLQKLLDRVLPDYCYALHNSGMTGGAWFALSRDAGASCYRQIADLLRQERITLQDQTIMGIEEYAPGMRHIPTMKSYYDYLEENGVAIPAEYTQGNIGASSQEYLMDMKPECQIFVAELTYGQHPGEASDKPTDRNLRRFQLELFTENRYLTSAMLEEWDKVAADLDTQSPFYRKIFRDLAEARSTVHGGMTAWYEPALLTILQDPGNDRVASERDCIAAVMFQNLFVANAHGFVRLLRASKQTDAVRQATARLERTFDWIIDRMEKHIDMSLFEVTDCDRLARAQLGSGLIALNALLEKRAA